MRESCRAAVTAASIGCRAHGPLFRVFATFRSSLQATKRAMAVNTGYLSTSRGIIKVSELHTSDPDRNEPEYRNSRLLPSFFLHAI